MITVHGANITRAELSKIKPVTPENAGRRWCAIPHGKLLYAIRREVLSRGWEIKEQLLSTARDGADMAGALLIEKVRGVRVVPGTSLAIGFLHSNARRKAVQLTVGASVTCCANGLCTGNILLNRVHDHTIDLSAEIKCAVDGYVEAAARIPNIVRGLKEHGLAPDEASEILMEAGRKRLVGWAAIGRVDVEYRRPTFAEHGRNTSWALLNAFTYAARANIAATRQMEVYNTFRQILPVGQTDGV